MPDRRLTSCRSVTTIHIKAEIHSIYIAVTMSFRIDQYIDFSSVDNPQEIHALYDALLVECRAHIGSHPLDFVTLKNALHACGFGYAYKSFKADSVIRERKGNCLGTPLLMSCLASEFGLDCRFHIVVSPQDGVYHDELRFLDDLRANTRYDRPELSGRPELMRWMRFAPLEHMVLEVDGHLFDTTPGESSDLPPYERGRSISFESALLCVLQDRSATAFNLDDFSTAKELALQVIRQDPDNREVHGFLARIAREEFDDSTLERHLAEYLRIGADDSLALGNRFALTDDNSLLKRALDLYPVFAEILGYQARALVGTDPGEARVQYSIVSRLCTESVILELPRFYSEHFRELGILFGPDNVIAIMNNLADQENSWGTFDYHCALHELTGDMVHRHEAKETITVPHQELKLLRARSENSDNINQELDLMDSRFATSYLYRNARARLWGKGDSL
jgi:hypothetical protein